MKDQTRHIPKKTKWQPVSKIRLPFKLTRWTVCFAALALIFCAEVSALVIQHAHKNNSKLPSDTTSSASQTDTTHPLNITPTSPQSSPTQPTSPQSTTPTQSSNST